MALRSTCHTPRVFCLVLVLALSAALAPGPAAATSGVFDVRLKFTRHGGGGEDHLSALREHDGRRHGRLLAAIDLPLGGSGLATDTGLYFTRIGIGTPAKGYYVQVDTGSDILWVNCVSCDGCPRKSNLGIELTMYDPRGSDSGQLVTCDQEFCVENYGGVLPSCTTTSPCQYSITYGDGSSTAGFFVTDFLQYNQVTGDGQTTPANASVTFGCGAKLGGDLGSSNLALDGILGFGQLNSSMLSQLAAAGKVRKMFDGILGFGQSNSSMLSQLAAAGKVRKMFAHCLDTVNGGGIFAIGNVVQPKATLQCQPEEIDVGGTPLQLPTNIFDSGNSKGTMIDSGTTLAYVPEVVYKAMLAAVFYKHQDISLQTVQDFSCFQYSGSVDDGFLDITFLFEGDVSLTISPHDYLFQNGNLYCMGFQNGGLQSKDGKDMVLLGDLVLSNKLVVYDLENQAIGWTDYNCSSSIKINDDNGSAYTVNADNISSGCKFQWHKSLILLLATTVGSYLVL